MNKSIKIIAGFMMILVLIIWCGTRDVVVADKTINKEQKEWKDSKLPNSYKPNIAIENGNVVIFTTVDSNGEAREAHNISTLDKFIDDVNSNKKTNVSILEYKNDFQNKLLNKMINLQYDGKEIKYIGYDYSSKKYFKVGNIVRFSKIIKIRQGEDIKYILIGTQKERLNNEITILNVKNSNLK